ncbi:hypothetical protein A2U01_0005993 [Trifolium medium]|uniref:Uncharacterized protein n=1 Tax=Trifolium medium TaxID=97028 RepID=A0A392MDM0_9FABA|nr:hypothetical protein [Trifolium medium]
MERDGEIAGRRLFEWDVLLRWKNGSMMKKGRGGGEW